MKAIVPISVIAASIAISQPAAANIISDFETRFNTDFTSAGVGGLRGNGSGDINLTGVTGDVNKAYLYWHGPTNSSDPEFNANISLNSNSVTGTNIGFSDDNFWNQSNSQAYRADVTGLVSGDGTFSLSGLRPDHSNGASLVVFFDDQNDANNRDIVLFDGNDANFENSFDPLGWDVTLSGINYSGGPASMLLGVSDGQNFGIGDDGSFFLNGTELNSSDIFDGASVPVTPGSSVTNGGLWDLLDFDITSFLSVGSNTLNLTHGPENDALSAIHFAINLPVGSAPDQPDEPQPPRAVPEPATLALLGPGLLALFMVRRRRKQ